MNPDVIAFYGVMKDSYIYFFILKIIFHVYLPDNAKQRHFLSFVSFKSELKMISQLSGAAY